MISVHRSGLSDEPGRSHLRWAALALLALVIDLVDTFWTTSLRGAVGAIDKTQEPFHAWVRTSALMLPLYLLAVAAAALIARRLVRASRRKVVKSLTVGVLTIATTTLVGIAAITLNAAQDYHVQSEQLTVVHAGHVHAAGPVENAAGVDHAGHAGHTTAGAGCDALCQAKRSTLRAHERAIAYGARVLLLTNAVFVSFLVGLWGVRLWTRYTPTTRPTQSGFV